MDRFRDSTEYPKSMEDQIRHKLTSALSSPVSTEAQAVYALVQLRKLLDRRKARGLPDFSYLRFLSDWVVHIKLQGATAQRIIQDAQDLYQKSQAGTFTEAEKAYFRGLFTLEPVREELRDLSEDSGLPIMSDATWNSFLGSVLSVIEDCPLSLRLQPGTNADVDEVVFSREMGTVMEGANGGPPRIVWQFKSGGTDVLWLTANEVGT